MNDDGGTEGLDGWAALGRTGDHLIAHLFIFLGVTLLVTLFAMWVVKRDAADGKSRFRDFALYCGAFSAFGIATAYFLSLGLSAASGDANSILQPFVAPFISLLTGGVAFAASKTREGVASKHDLVLGVTCFLLTCILSYETFRGQALHGEGTVPEVPNTMGTNNGTDGTDIEPPANRQEAPRHPGPASPPPQDSRPDDIEPPRR